MKHKLFYFLFVLLLFGCFSAVRAESARKKATVMLYMCGSTLEMPPIYKEATAALEKIRNSGFDEEDVNIAALLGGTRSWSGGYDSSVLTLLTFGRSETEEHFPLSPMNDPHTLSDFLRTCYERFPAEQYILIIWDHGGGPNIGVCQDALFANGGVDDLEANFLSVAGLAEAFRDSPFAEQKLDLLVFSCCLMSSAELSAAIAPYVKYMAAAEDQMYGLSYDWLPQIGTDPDILSTAKRLVDSTYEYNEEIIQRQGALEINSFSIVDLAKAGEVAEASDEYFVYLSEGMDDLSFGRISDRRREMDAFGAAYQMEYNFDLVDLADFAEQNSGTSREAADRLVAAVRDAVVYNRSASASCSGLTIYHPFLNKQRLVKWMSVHQKLGFSEGYSAYLNRFVSLLTGTPLAEWTDLATGTPDADKAVRTVFKLDLTEEQSRHYGDSRLIILHKSGDEGYAFTHTADSSLRDTEISGEFLRRVLYVEDSSGIRLTGELEYSVDDRGFYHVPVVLGWTDPKTGTLSRAAAVIVCEYIRAFRELAPKEILIREENMGLYRTIPGADLQDFDCITFSTILRRETRNADGTLLPFSMWDVVDASVWDIDPRNEYYLVLSEAVPPLSELYAIFEITDTQNNLYCSEPLAVRGTDPDRNADRSGSVVNYDDGDLILITDHRIVQRDDRLNLTLRVQNLLDRESVIGIESVTVDGAETSAAAETWGNGANGGQEPAEEQDLYLSLSLPEGTGQAAEITFILYTADPLSGTRTGEIPVEITLQ